MILTEINFSPFQIVFPINAMKFLPQSETPMTQTPPNKWIWCQPKRPQHQGITLHPARGHRRYHLANSWVTTYQVSNIMVLISVVGVEEIYLKGDYLTKNLPWTPHLYLDLFVVLRWMSGFFKMSEHPKHISRVLAYNDHPMNCIPVIKIEPKFNIKRGLFHLAVSISVLEERGVKIQHLIHQSFCAVPAATTGTSTPKKFFPLHASTPGTAWEQ